MRKSILSSVAMLTAISANAQSSMFGNFANTLKSEVETLFPIILSLVFIVCALFNLGNFFGENRDVKKGITNILIYVGGAAMIVGVYSYLSGMSL